MIDDYFTVLILRALYILTVYCLCFEFFDFGSRVIDECFTVLILRDLHILTLSYIDGFHAIFFYFGATDW